MVNKFNNEDFDGVSIELKEWFIRLNPSVKVALDNLLSTLKDVESNGLSTFEPHFLSSIYELENMDSKKESIKLKKESSDLKAKLAMEKNLLFNTNKMFKIQLTKSHISLNMSEPYDNIRFVFPDGEVFYSSDYITRNCNIKMTLINKFNEHVSSYDKLVEFNKCMPIFNDILNYYKPFLDKYLSVKLRINLYGILYITWSSLSITYASKSKRGKPIFRESYLLHENSNFRIPYKVDFDLNDYKIDLNKMVLKHKTLL